MTDTQIFSDKSLSRRLERTEGRSCASFVEARARAFPDLGAKWIDVCGVYAMFDGSDSPVTQTFGLGLFDPIATTDLDRIEKFFQERRAPVFHEVSPLADAAIFPLLNERAYQPCEFTTVLYRPIVRGASYTELRNDKIRVRLTTADEVELWAQTSSRGWSEFAELADFMLNFGKVVAQRADGLSFIALLLAAGHADEQGGEQAAVGGGRVPGPPPAGAVALAAELERHPAGDQGHQQQQEGRVEPGEHGRVPAGEGGEGRGGGDDQPDLVAVPQRPDRLEGEPPALLVAADDEVPRAVT